MDGIDFRSLERRWKKEPLHVLAEEFSMTVIELTSLLRNKGISKDIKPEELQYISENIDRMAPDEIRDKLSLTPTQFSQILEKTLRKKQRKPLAEMSLSEVIDKTKWLIETKLNFKVDDRLPRKITQKHFSDNGLYNCIRFAVTEKKKDSALYLHFTATAFLVCQAYPDKFRPFQFKHAKTNEYFKGPGGKKNLINAAKWVIEEKIHYKREFLSDISSNKYFLRSKDLQFYGIGIHQFRIHFESVEEFISAILKEYSIISNNIRRGQTKELRETLSNSGKASDKCEVIGCNWIKPDIHHIIPVSASNRIKFDINCVENIISLCPNHHRVAGKFGWEKLNLKEPDTWRESILEYISE